ncbi:MAG: Ig-like domain-containing protein [Chitinispirillaceae bacterium]|nr:Ig-like domain-containing protein [Chitinispirillaceae bacterium]
MTTAPRKLWTAGLILSLGLFCTIRDENGNPAAPGTDTPAVEPVDVTITPSIFASPDSAYVQPGDTIGIRVSVFADTTSTDSLKPIASFPVTARANRGTILDDSLLTDVNGRARFLYTNTESGNIEFTVAGNNVSQTVRFEVTTTPVRVQKLLQAMPGASIIQADGRDTTSISVAVLNPFRNPIVGECVQFISSAGTIAGNGGGCANSGQSKTGADGIARATLRSSNINDTAYITIYLVSDQSLSDEVEVAFQGMTIVCNASKNNMKRGDTSIVTAKVLNASSQPVARAPIFFNFGKGPGSNLTVLSVDTFTNYEGVAAARILADRTGSDIIDIAAAGTKASLQINVSELSIAFELDKTILQTSNTDTAKITVTFSNAAGNPLGNRTIKLNRHFKTADDIDTADDMSASTNSSGECTFSIVALPWEGSMRLNAIGFDNAEGYASADTMLQFITTRVMSIRAPQPILADGVSRGPVMVFVKNKSGNPIVGDYIIFTTTAGTIAAKALTNADGKAEALIISDRRNITATITATLESDPTKRLSTTVQFKGIELTASANPPSIRSNGTDSATVLITLLDAAKIPIMGERFNISKQQNATFITSVDTATNNDGQAYCKISGTGLGQDTLLITAAGAVAPVVVNYSSNLLYIDTASGQACIADSTDSTLIVVSYLKGDRTTPIPNATINLAATVGKMDTIFARTFTTDANGRTSFYLRNPHFAVTTTIFGIAQSTSEMTTGAFRLYFKANKVNRIDLSGTPEVITIEGGRAKLEAIAFDSMGNRVKDANISFNLVNGPSGGEYLDPPTAITGDDGRATSYLISGKTPSHYRQVWITAGSFSSVKSDTVKFTIAGPPRYINVAYNILEGKNPKDGTFLLPCAAVVTDVNGNPVADGTEVTFSLKISGYVIGKLSTDWYDNWNEDHTWHSWWFYIDTLPIILPFEDFNDNYHLDPGEDRNRDGFANRGEDVNGDGIFNPGPRFEDINHDGIRQYDISIPVEERASWWSTYYDYADLNHNNAWDPIEPLLVPEYTEAYYRLVGDSAFFYGGPRTAQDTADYATIRRLDSIYTEEAARVGGFDIDASWDGTTNGIADPHTAVSITRTVQTKDGKALNMILYGQSDALRIEVMFWAEAQGVVTESPAQLVLPIVIDKEKE